MKRVKVMEIQFMKPIFVIPTGNIIKLVFAYQSISIFKDGEILDFINIEGQEIILNVESRKLENPNEIFVFQNGDKFVRASLPHLMWACKGFADRVYEITGMPKEGHVADIAEPTEMELLFEKLEEFNVRNLIDSTLDQRDFETARKLMSLCKQTKTSGKVIETR